MTRRDTTEQKTARRRAYSLAAGATAATTAMTGADAEAQIVWSTPQNIAIAQSAEQTLNLDGDYYYDIQLKNYIFDNGNYQGAFLFYSPGKFIGFKQGLSYASALEAGAVIDEITTESGGFVASLAYGANNPNAEFNDTPNAYLGFGFPIAGVNHYGWLRVTIDNEAGAFVVRDWAYNIEPGKGIAAGQRADFNGDGVTNAADYTVWRDTLGTTRVGDEFINADVDLSNEVDQADYDVWAADYGLSAILIPASASNTVPEPMTLGLLAAGAAGLGVLRGARRRELKDAEGRAS